MKNITKVLKKVPVFKNDDDERNFWNTHDSTNYVDWDKAANVVFPNLKPTTEAISLRLPSTLLARLKELANSKDVPYQSLMKVYLAQRVKEENSGKYEVKSGRS